MGLNRRSLLLGAGGVMVVLGAEGARRVWAEVAAEVPPAIALEARHMAIITTLADIILPATDTPGAIDVGVPAWVAHVLSDSFEAAERTRLLRGLDALDIRARSEFGGGIADLAAPQLQSLLDPLDRPGRFQNLADRVVGVLSRRVSVEDAAGGLFARFALERHSFREMKSLIVHGYFTSEPVQHMLDAAQPA